MSYVDDMPGEYDPNVSPLAALIAKLEAAVEGSRELDVEIGPHAPFSNTDEAPRYTTSLDAALTLVPEGWFWRVGRTSNYQAWAGINATHPDHGEPGRNEFFWRRELWEPPSTAPIALCIVALRARQVQP